MGIKIDREKCNGCNMLKDGLCIRVCPGNLIHKDNENKAEISDCGECWDCSACVKECPRRAISMYLEPQIGGRGSTLTAKKERGKIEWTIKRADGEIEIIETQRGGK